jgi:phosphoserine aminotransferase
VNIVTSGKSSGYTTIPEVATWNVDPNSAYLHYTANETLSGVEFKEVPPLGVNIPLVADMTSNLLAYPIDVSRFGMIYAGTQKNMGIAGLSVVIIREDLLGQPMPTTPQVFDYQIQAQQKSMLVTPPTFAWYVTGLVLEWLKKQGGLAKIAEINLRKAKKLYATLDNSALYINRLDKRYRSTMNVTFTMQDSALVERFLKEAELQNLKFLKGHSVLGGVRASIYNGVEEKAVDALVDFMCDFEKRV